MSGTTERKEKMRTITAVGDILVVDGLARDLLGQKIKELQGELKQFLGESDLVLGNLECPITDFGSKLPGELWNFKMDPALAPLLCVFSGLSLANNHILDYKWEGLKDTMSELNKLGIKFCGAGENIEEAEKPAILDCDGFSVGMLGFTDRNWYPAGSKSAGTYTWQGGRSQALIKSLRKTTDFVIAHMHQGYEFIDYPGPEELFFANELINAGVDLVLGHHSHTIMGIGRKGHSAVIYGLGNFIFDPEHLPSPHFIEMATNRIIVRFKVAPHEIRDWSVEPFIGDQNGWPKRPPEKCAIDILNHFREISSILQDEAETVKRFQQQASRNMLPYALKALATLLQKEGPAAVFDRLIRLRPVDFSVLFSFLRKPGKNNP